MGLIYYLPDPTGENPDFYQENIPQYIYRNGQIVEFINSPVFVSSLQIKMTDGSASSLVQGTDWTVEDSDVDQTAMAQAYLENLEFSDTLVKSITLTSSKALDKTVSMSFQEFYLTTPGRLFDDGTPFEVTPDLIKGLVTAQAEMRQQLARVTSPVAPVNEVPVLLPFDINKEFAGNVVTGEVIPVNTAIGAKVLRLVQGAFFADSLVISYNGAPLNPETDYLPINLSPLTKVSVNRGGIYQQVLLNIAITGQVTISYHAVGGDVQASDIKALYDRQAAITDFLNNGLFTTPSSIVNTPAFRAMNARLNQLETNVRSILSGPPTYGDSSAGMMVRRPIAAVDSNFHWWTIAKLYQVQGSTDIVTADQFRGRVFLPGANIAFAFVADVNLKQPRQPISFKTESLVFDPTYTLFSDVSANAPVYPMLRLVWGQVSQTFSGAYLQIGLPLTALSDQMIVEDLSTTESCWILDQTGAFVTGNTVIVPTSPMDSGFTLPDGHTTWSTVSASSYAKVCVPTYAPGYLVYSGSNVALTQLNTQATTKNLFNVVLPNYFPIANINSIVVTLQSLATSNSYDVEIALPTAGSGSKIGRYSFVDSIGEAMSMAVTLLQDSAGNITVSLNLTVPNPASTNPLTDVVRYIRAKV